MLAMRKHNIVYYLQDIHVLYDVEMILNSFGHFFKFKG